MSDILEALADASIQFQQLKEENDEAQARIKELEMDLVHARDWLSRLQVKIQYLERGEGTDAWDERYLFDHQCTLQFKTRSTGDARVVLTPRGRKPVIVAGKNGEALLRQALDASSGRTRAA